MAAPPADTLVGLSPEAAPPDLESALAAEAAVRDANPAPLAEAASPAIAGESPMSEEQVPARPTLADSPCAVAAAMPVEEDPVEQQAGSPPLPEVREEEISVPPASDLEAGGFFDSQPHMAEPEIEVDTRDPRLAMKMTAHAARRRAHLAKYVLATVGLMSALLVAALVKGAVEDKQGAEQARHAEGTSVTVAAALSKPGEAAHATATLAAAPAEVAPAPVANVDTAKAVDPQPTAQGADPVGAVAPDVPAPVATAAAVEDKQPAAEGPPPAATTTAATGTAPAPADTTPPPAATTVAVADTTTDNAAEAPTPDPKAAAKEKAASRNALEWGKVKDSIEAGERAVALDPTDGEAWLILGAAYQQKGDGKEARRCFKACLEQGKRGPKGECSAMLR